MIVKTFLTLLPCMLPSKLERMYCLQSHGFHLAFTAIIGLAMYQGVIAAARNAGDLDIWSGILMIAAVAILLLPLLAVPFIFGGFKAKQRKPRLDPELLKVCISFAVQQIALQLVFPTLASRLRKGKTVPAANPFHRLACHMQGFFPPQLEG